MHDLNKNKLAHLEYRPVYICIDNHTQQNAI